MRDPCAMVHVQFLGKLFTVQNGGSLEATESPTVGLSVWTVGIVHRSAQKTPCPPKWKILEVTSQIKFGDVLVWGLCLSCVEIAF